MQSLVKLGVQESMLQELFGLPQHTTLIPLFELGQFLFTIHKRVNKHSQIFCEHIGLGIYIIINIYFLHELKSKRRITYKKVLAKCKIMVLPHLLHGILHEFLHLVDHAFLVVNNIFIIKLHNHINYNKQLLLYRLDQKS